MKFNKSGIILFIAVIVISCSSCKHHTEDETFKPVESSYDSTESKALENIFIQSLSAYLTPDAKVYDQIKNDTLDLKFVSINLNLKHDMLEGSKELNDLGTASTQLLYSMYPDKKIAGSLNYFYNGKPKGSLHLGVLNIVHRQ